MQISKCSSELLKIAQPTDQPVPPSPIPTAENQVPAAPAPAAPPAPVPAAPAPAAPVPAAQPAAIPPLDTKHIAEAFAKAAKDLQMPVAEVQPMAFVDGGYFVFCEGRPAAANPAEAVSGKPIAEIVFKVYPSGTSAEIKRGLEIGAQRLEREIIVRACQDSGIAAVPTGRQEYNFVLASDPDHFAPMAAAERQQQGMTGQVMPGQVGPAMADQGMR